MDVDATTLSGIKRRPGIGSISDPQAPPPSHRRKAPDAPSGVIPPLPQLSPQEQQDLELWEPLESDQIVPVEEPGQTPSVQPSLPILGHHHA